MPFLMEGKSTFSSGVVFLLKWSPNGRIGLLIGCFGGESVLLFVRGFDVASASRFLDAAVVLSATDKAGLDE